MHCKTFSRRANKIFPDILFESNTLRMCDELLILGVSIITKQTLATLDKIQKKAIRLIGDPDSYWLSIL